mmetsp:Transcript_36519/g.91547  ORF Transcript_36519/g.91547 Transcript_36519/m.91547 type:complete len:258 (-) Transcript_36519:309-1082(-)
MDWRRLWSCSAAYAPSAALGCANTANIHRCGALTRTCSTSPNSPSSPRNAAKHSAIMPASAGAPQCKLPKNSLRPCSACSCARMAALAASISSRLLSHSRCRASRTSRLRACSSATRRRRSSFARSAFSRSSSADCKRAVRTARLRNNFACRRCSAALAAEAAAVSLAGSSARTWLDASESGSSLSSNQLREDSCAATACRPSTSAGASSAAGGGPHTDMARLPSPPPSPRRPSLPPSLPPSPAPLSESAPATVPLA